MTTPILNRLWIPVLFASLNLCLAQPSGQVKFRFDNGVAPVWDLTGSYVMEHSTQSAGVPMPVAFFVGVENSAKGDIRGSGIGLLQIGADYVAAQYNVVGKVSGGGNDTRVSLSVRLTGLDQIAGTPRKFSVSLQYKFKVDAETRELVGTSSGSVYVNGIGSSRIKENTTVPLPEGADGTWDVSLNLLALNRIGGSGKLEIANYTSPDNPAGFPTDRLVPTSVSGSYSTRTGHAKLSITGLYDGRGSSISLTFNPQTKQVVKLSGKVLGQKVRIN